MIRLSKPFKFSIFAVLLGSTVFCGRLKFFQNANANIDEAIALCNKEGMDLVTIENATEHQRIRDFLDCMGSSSSLTTDIWIGLYYDEDTEEFYWMSDGSQTTYTDWEPSNCSGFWRCDQVEPNSMPPDGDEGNVRLSVENNNYYFKTREGYLSFDVLCEETGPNPSYLGCPVTTSTTASTTTTTTTTTPTTTTSSTTLSTSTPTTIPTTTATKAITTTIPSTTTPTTIKTTPTTTTPTTTTQTTTTTTTTQTTPKSTTTTPTTTTTSTTTKAKTTTTPSTTVTIPTTTTPTAPLSTSTITTLIGTRDGTATALASTTSKNYARKWEKIGWTLGGTAAFALLVAVALCLRRLICARKGHFHSTNEQVINVKDRPEPRCRGQDKFRRSSGLTTVESLDSGSSSTAAKSPIPRRLFDRSSGPISLKSSRMTSTSTTAPSSISRRQLKSRVPNKINPSIAERFPPFRF